MKARIVFDTNVVISALLYRGSRLPPVCDRWQHTCTPVVSRETVGELVRVLNYGRFRLSAADVTEALAEYLPYAEQIGSVKPSGLKCRDSKDQMFLDLAHSARVDALVSGDQDLLVLRERAKFRIITPAEYLAESP